MKLPVVPASHRALWRAGALLAGGLLVGYVAAHRSPSAKEGSLCSGEYADSLQGQSARTREIEQGQGAYTHLVRASARYECPYFGSDGKLRRKRLQAIEHATAFAYETVGDETFLLTNEHLVDWPEVTDSAHKVEGVQDGCKRVEQKLRIVHDDREDEDSTQIPLTLVASDPLLDSAILKAPQKLGPLPYHVGRSSALRNGNAVLVRGFPLGLMAAVNTGKVVNSYDRDQEQGWDHVDFVIDALLSEGNSGSPVLALSCRTGELELVGVYHAGYKGASALNVVVGIDQLRDFMQRKRRVPRVTSDVADTAFGPAARDRVRERLRAGALPLIELGDRALLVESVGSGFRYHLYGRGFPLDDRRAMVLEDQIGPDGLPRVAQLTAWGEGGTSTWITTALGPEDQELLLRVGEAVRLQLIRTLDHRAALVGGGKPETRRRAHDIERSLERAQTRNRELLANLLELVDRLAPSREPGAVASRGVMDAGVPPAPLVRAPSEP